MTYGRYRMGTKPGVDWAEIERRVRAGESARAVSRDLTSTGNKISHTAINKHCKRGGWRLPDTSAPVITRHLQDTGARQRTAAEVLGADEAVGRDSGHIPSGTPNKENIPNYQDDSPPAIPDGTAAPSGTDPHQAATAANHAPARDMDSDTTEQELPTAAMADRTVIQWDKDDLDAMGFLKIDVLALGMLTCVRKAFELLNLHYGRALDLASVPAEDPCVYDMLCRADSIGVFQVESRAQMAFLPRMKPRNFYDLVIEVAIVRPGPIQGDMVHPYLRRRDGIEPVVYPSAALEAVLGKTLGVPLFQEQAMKIAIVAAGFTPGEADGLRRAMATFRRSGTIHKFRAKMIDGMTARGYDEAFATRCFQQIEGSSASTGRPTIQIACAASP